jgi:polysaccharide pyruvyl transferase WcaK-like protein
VERFRDDGRERVHADQAVDLITRWVRRTGEPVAIVPEVARLLEAHRTMVYDRLPDDVRPLVRFMGEYWMPDEAQAVYAQARMVVSAEMHSVILGLAAGTPSLHPYFAQAGLKQWMMRDLGLEDWLLDMDAVPADRILDAMLAVRGDQEGALRRTRSAMAVVERRQRETMAVVGAAAARGRVGRAA